MNRTTFSRAPETAHGVSAPDEFADFLVSRQANLLRTAYLLTGDEAAAQELVTVSLARLYLSWARVRSREDPDVFTRRALFDAALGPRWRASRRPSGSTQARENGGSDLWRAIRSLPLKQRAVVVLRFHEGLSAGEAAGVLGMSERRVAALATRARQALGVPPAEAEG
jgi:DNA-directed RNA polymerase specialized sigma24 family protein